MEGLDKYLIEILEFYIHKLKTGGCTMDEINSVAKVIEQNIELNGTISDLAQFYGVSENNIRATIARKLLDKPKRVLLYPFHKFSKIIPEKWRTRQ